MSVANIITGIGSGVFGGGLGMAVLQAIISTRSRRAQAARTETETEGIEHGTWFKEAEAAYARVDKECKECKNELHTSNERHDKDMSKIRREVGELREALIKSVDRVDELLPYVQGLPDEKLREHRAANRAVRRAVWVQP